MKLNEIKQVNVGYTNLTEGVIPVHISMTLQQVIDAGKITNSVQTFIVAQLLSMFKDGGPYRWPRDLNSYGSETPSDVIDAIKSLADSEIVELCEWLLEQLEAPASFEATPNASMNTQEWVKYVLRKQD